MCCTVGSKPDPLAKGCQSPVHFSVGTAFERRADPRFGHGLKLLQEAPSGVIQFMDQEATGVRRLRFARLEGFQPFRGRFQQSDSLSTESYLGSSGPTERMAR